MAPSGSSTPRSARSPATGSARWCSTPVQTTWSKRISNSAARSIGSTRTLEILEIVLLFELLRAAHAGRAEVDAGHSRGGPPHGVLRGLRRPAAGDEDGVILAEGPCGPEQVMVLAPQLPVLPERSVSVQVVHRRWIRIPLVELLNVRRRVREHDDGEMARLRRHGWPALFRVRSLAAGRVVDGGSFELPPSSPVFAAL